MIIPEERTVPASSFVGTISANVDNIKLTDEKFRQFVRNTLPIVIYDGCEKEEKEEEI